MLILFISDCKCRLRPPNHNNYLKFFTPVLHWLTW